MWKRILFTAFLVLTAFGLESPRFRHLQDFSQLPVEQLSVELQQEQELDIEDTLSLADIESQSFEI